MVSRVFVIPFSISTRSVVYLDTLIPLFISMVRKEMTWARGGLGGRAGFLGVGGRGQGGERYQPRKRTLEPRGRV